jgi:hypothetical protein
MVGQILYRLVLPLSSIADVFLKFNAVSRIPDVCLGSRSLIFIHPGSWIRDPTTAIKEEVGNKFLAYK